MKELFVLWLIAVMNTMAPAHRDHLLREAQESYAQADARYREIATNIIDVSFDPSERPLFGGAYGRAKTAMFIAHIFYLETGFRRDLHYGIGRERLSASGYNDNGRSWCLGQIMLGVKKVNTGNGMWTTDSASTTPEGWTGRELLADTNKCVRATLHTLHRSMGACSGLPLQERMAAYATGSCSSETGKRISRTRFSSFYRRWDLSNAKRPQVKDDQFHAPVPEPTVTALNP